MSSEKLISRVARLWNQSILFDSPGGTTRHTKCIGNFDSLLLEPLERGGSTQQQGRYQRRVTVGMGLHKRQGVFQ
jgi:hypothetical protein